MKVVIEACQWDGLPDANRRDPKIVLEYRATLLLQLKTDLGVGAGCGKTNFQDPATSYQGIDLGLIFIWSPGVGGSKIKLSDDGKREADLVEALRPG
jgi:hypothetical protein